MSTRVRFERVPVTNLVLATVLLIGVLLVGYGYSHPSATSFYAGLLTIIGGVIFGVIRLVTR